MKVHRKIDRARALALLDYDPTTGVLRWKARPENPQFTARFAGKVAGTIHKTDDGKAYRALVLDRMRLLAHRVIWTMVEGEIPDDMLVDHEDGDGLNNAWENIQLVDVFGNMQNVRRSVDNQTGVLGVRRASTRSERYQAFLTVRGEFIHLGLFDTVADAAAARRAADAVYGFHPNHGSERPLARLPHPA